MKLFEFINILMDRQHLSDFFSGQGIDIEEETISICLVEKCAPDADVVFVKEEESDSHNEYVRDGSTYVTFFTVDHAFDLIHEDLAVDVNGLSNFEIANRLVEYWHNDA